MHKYKIIGKGEQGIVYELDDKTVLKVFNNTGRRIKRNEEIEVAKRMSKLSLKRFVKPFSIKVVNKILVSYKMIKINFDKIPLGKIKMKKYIKSLKMIRSDTKKLSEAGIKINDLQEHNIGIENGLIKIYDTSDYSIKEDKSLEKLNDEAINECFGSFCLSSCAKDKSIELYDNFYKPFLLSGKQYVEDYMTEKVEDEEDTLGDFVKKMVRR